MGKLRTLCASLLLGSVIVPSVAKAQETGQVTGQVTATESGAGLSGAQVRIQGSSRQTVTDAAGRYRITGIAPGSYTLTVSIIGRAAGSRAVTVTGGQATTANFTLAASAIALEGVTVNAVTGESERRREVGANVARIDVADIQRGPITKVADVLTGRTAGVTLQGAAGTTGTAQRIRIRGANSLSLSNEPLIFVDGIRTSNNNSGFAVGGQQPTRLNDINPEDIENIEVLKGPAASALYGTAAANGVLLITTRRGRAGSATWRTYGELTSLEDVNNYPLNYQALRTLAGGAGQPFYETTFGEVNTAAYAPCTNEASARAACVQDQFLSFDQFRDSRTTPFSTGNRSKVGLNVSGGSNALTYYLSADHEGETNVLEWNTLARTNLRANLSAQITPDLTVQVNAGYINSDLALAQGDNNVFSPFINAYLGTAQYVEGMEREFGFGEYRIGSYFGQNNADVRRLITNQLVDRYLLGSNASFRPTSWLALNANAGLDFFARFDHETVQPNIFDLAQDYIVGYRDAQRTNHYLYTTNASGTASFDLSQAVASQTTAGVSYQRSNSSGVECYGIGQLAGTSSCSAVTQLFSVAETFNDDRIFGAFAQQQFALNDRFFLVGAVRGDRNSGLVDDFIIYPSANASWVVSEEPFFPEIGLLSNLRLRAAYGESGLRPSFGQAETFFGARPVLAEGIQGLGAILTQTGNATLKPERTREIEFGLDAGFFDDRLSANFTYFNKRSKDALVSRNLAPSLGLTGTVFQNLGSVRNSGTETDLNMLVLDRTNSRLNVRLALTTLTNEIEELGQGIAPISLNRGTQQHREGYSIGGFFALPYRYEDLNNDGKIARTEVFVDSARFITNPDGTRTALEYLGPQLPTNTQALSADLTLFRNFTVSTLFERRAGAKTVNYTEYFRCNSANTYQFLGLCSAMGNPNASLEEQARFVAASVVTPTTNRTLSGFIEDADFIKWREVAVRIGVPESLSRNIRALRGASISLAGRNLMTWSDYTGVDPEVNESGSGSSFNQGEFNTQPPVRYFTARLDLTF